VTTARARELRKNPTQAESVLWKHLRYRQLDGHKFRRQVPIGPYIADFMSLENRLIIEVDGGHHPDRAAYDSERTTWLQSQGFCVLRFWNNQVLQDIESVKEAILKALEVSR
jgi:adenine-specific DNA-methyltransferase